MSCDTVSSRSSGVTSTLLSVTLPAAVFVVSSRIPSLPMDRVYGAPEAGSAPRMAYFLVHDSEYRVAGDQAGPARRDRVDRARGRARRHPEPCQPGRVQEPGELRQ